MGSIYWFAIGAVSTVVLLWAARKFVRAIRRFIGGEDPESECERRFMDHEMLVD